ncbi:phosphatidylinositol 5-phosphate 4-kinase type-2 gamma-like [Rhincodon typus]|uniref:phosphatidylinositol 5-phosphate 4-kinase type-2 gamma-like n=1 Tax=Rhincodon typus TaxID=259920 RepID=UPI00202E275C|nr:phosphatidylinositol 5-phosphate 4-kinase type-2 gamma-like [Rhincodon typus]
MASGTSGSAYSQSQSQSRAHSHAPAGSGAHHPAALSSSASKTKTKKKHFVSQKVSVFRAGSPLVSVFMWGVNHSINELNHVPVPVMLLPDDFKANSKIKVINHLFNKENLPSNFKFKEYCPQVFRNLRERFNIDDQDYLASMTRSAPYSENEVRNTVLFLSSYDKKYVIKQISSEDVAEMHSFLSDYHEHVVNCHGNIVLPHFLAMYRLTVDGEDTYILVMRNVFSYMLTVHRKYDLKVSERPQPPHTLPDRLCAIMPRQSISPCLPTMSAEPRAMCLGVIIVSLPLDNKV